MEEIQGLQETSDSVIGYDIPNELIELRGIAQKAANIMACSTIKTRADAITATATIFGAKADLIKYLNDPSYSDAAHRLADQLLTATNPKGYDFAPGIGIPWKRETIRKLVYPLADNAIATGSQLLPTDPENLLIKSCLGFGRILDEGKKSGIIKSPRCKHLIECCQRIEAAIKSEDYWAPIGYIPYNDPRQMTFDFK